MEQKTWTTPEELIEMTHWLSGAPGKRWVVDRWQQQWTWGAGTTGGIGLVLTTSAGRLAGPVTVDISNAPYEFVRDDSEPAKASGIAEAEFCGGLVAGKTQMAVQTIVRRCEEGLQRIARIVVRQELVAAEVVKDADGKLRIVAGV